ncbi:MAG: hypothetical protein ABJB40_01455 [Acidobacteriota bacterium]
MNKTRIIGSVIAAAIVLIVGCQKAANTNTGTNQSTTNANQSVNAATPAPANTSSEPVSGTPTEAYKAAYAARKSCDVAALKKLMSKDIIDFMTDIGSSEKKTLDDELKEMCKRPQAKTDDVRNEKINGDKATVEYPDEKGKWQTMDFVKEDGAWKLTINKDDNGSPDDDKDDKDNK